MSEYMLNADEDICALTKNGYRLIQKKKGFRFSIDAVLLAHFPALKAELKVLDLGSGNGVLPLLLKDREPSLKISGVEIQEASAQLARRNMGAHRTPEAVEEFAKGARKRGIKIIIAAAGMAAALPGVIAANTTLPLSLIHI